MLLGKRGKKKMGVREERESFEKLFRVAILWKWVVSAEAIVEEGGKNPVDMRFKLGPLD